MCGTSAPAAARPPPSVAPGIAPPTPRVALGRNRWHYQAAYLLPYEPHETHRRRAAVADTIFFSRAAVVCRGVLLRDKAILAGHGLKTLRFHHLVDNICKTFVSIPSPWPCFGLGGDWLVTVRHGSQLPIGAHGHILGKFREPRLITELKSR